MATDATAAAPTDSALNNDGALKRRARRRLLGAIALVLTAIIVFPMVLDSTPKPLNQDIPITIPGKDDKPFVSAPPVAVAPAVTPPAVTPPAPAAKDKAKEAPKEPAKEAPKAPPKEVAKEAQKEAPKDTGKAKAEPAPAPPSAPAKEAPKSAAAQSEEARIKALLEGEAKAAVKAAPAAPSRGSYAVQIIALSAPEKIQEVRDKLSAAGIKTFTEKTTTASGEITRVRAGPFASLEAAQAARDKIRAAGFANANAVPTN